MAMKRKITLKRQVLTLLLFAIIFPVGIISAYNSYNTGKGLNEQFASKLSSNVTWTDETIKSIDKANIELADSLSMDPNAQFILKNADSQKWLMGSFDSFLKAHKDVINVYYGLKDGRMLLKPEQTLPSGFDPRQRSWYTSSLVKDGQVVVTDPYEDASHKGMYVITFAKSVKDPETGEVNGVIGVDLQLKTLSGLISNIKIGDNGYIAVVDKTGRIISHKNPDKLGKTVKDEKWIDQLLLSKKSTGEYVVDGQTMVTYNMKDEQTGWTIIGVVPKSEITTQINRDRMVTAGIALLFIIMAMAAGWGVANSITNPINRLVDILGKVKDGDFTVKVKKSRKLNYEVGVITESVEIMLHDMVEILQNILKTSLSIKESSEALVAVSEESSSVGEEVSRAVQQIAGGASEQAGSLDESSLLASELGEQVGNVIRSSRNMIEASVNVREVTKEGTGTVENLKQTFREASDANKELQEQIQDLANKSNRIGAITDTIKSITEQTSLLSLNASIEAARAGEAGRGFAVVAEEVRKLADQSASSALEINNVIVEIKGSVSSVLQRIEQAISLNDKSEESVSVTTESFVKIEKAILALEKDIYSVNETLKVINNNKDMVIEHITEVAAVAQETAATAEEVSASSEEQTAGLHEVVSSAEKLNLLADTLDEMVNKFKIE